ncbi:MAG: hypothetical protein CMJ77_22350 [Planctomycetaceae bacterium]|nr:hypothetical protein [Planctomycetaceae bacterium]
MPFDRRVQSFRQMHFAATAGRSVEIRDRQRSWQSYRFESMFVAILHLVKAQLSGSAFECMLI